MKIAKSTETPIKIGYSFLHTLFFITIGVNTALNPSTINKLHVFDPTIFPIATLAFPPSIRQEIESPTDTASSGQLVPKATTVNPIIIGDI